MWERLFPSPTCDFNTLPTWMKYVVIIKLKKFAQNIHRTFDQTLYRLILDYPVYFLWTVTLHSVFKNKFNKKNP